MKLIHSARLVSRDGDISPLCARNPRKLDLRKESWTTDPKAVTCQKCKAMLGDRWKEYGDEG